MSENSEKYPLHTAAERGDYDGVSSLLGRIENIDEQNEKGETPLLRAIYAGDTAIVELLLDNGADGDWCWDHYTYPIHLAASLGHLEIIKLLVKKGVPIDRKSNEMDLPIHCAAEEGHVHIVEYILDKCINVDVTNKYNYTSLHFAAKYGREKVVELLLRRNARSLPNLCNYYPIHFAAEDGYLEIVKMLIKQGHYVNKRSFFGGTPFNEASYYGYFDIVRLFFENGLFRNFSGVYEGLSPLHQAVNGNNREIVEYFLEKGVNIDLATKNGYTSLHLAAGNDNLELLKCLVKNGADINFKTNPKGFTALHFAARKCRHDILDFLIQNGATFIIKDNGECNILTMVSKKFNLLLSESEHRDHIITAKVIIKYIVLCNKNIQPNLPENFPFREELTVFWQECMCELEKMDTCFLKGAKISLYKILRNIFNEHKLTYFLFNENIIEKITDIEDNIKQFPLYANIKVFIQTAIKKAVKRQSLLIKSDLILDHIIIPHLPLEIRYNIFSYLTNSDLVHFIESTEQFDDKSV